MDTGLNEHIHRAAGYHEVFHIIPANKIELPLRVNRRGLDDAEASFWGLSATARIRTTEKDPECPYEEREDDEGKEKYQDAENEGLGVEIHVDVHLTGSMPNTA